MNPAMNRDLRRLLGAAVAPPGDAAAYNRGYRGEQGVAAAVVRPRTTEEVSTLLRFAWRNHVPVICQGANTGLVGASVTDGSGQQILLNMSRMREERETNAAERTAWWQAGARLSEVNREAARIGCNLPIDLGADPSLGGMIATNTQGARFLRYGDMRANLLGIELVLFDEDGTVVDDLAGLRKDNSGIDFKHIFAGGGGVGGIVTEAKVRLHRLPHHSAAALLIPRDRKSIDALVRAAEDYFGPLLSACEGMSRLAMEAAFRHQPALRNPFAQGSLPEYAILVELSIAAGAASLVDLDAVLVEGLGSITAKSASLADALIGDPAALWAVRHAISDGVRAMGTVTGFDLAFPRAHVEAFHEAATRMLAAAFPAYMVADFGHRGDGGVHFNLVRPGTASGGCADSETAALRLAIYDLAVRRFAGTFSAEHGLGPANAAFAQRYSSEGAALLRARLADALDPRRLSGGAARPAQPITS